MGSFLFKEWSFKGAVRANPKFLSASIHDLHFLVAAGFLALITSKDAFDRRHNNIMFMKGFNVCVWAELKWLYLHSQQNPYFIEIYPTNIPCI